MPNGILFVIWQSAAPLACSNQINLLFLVYCLLFTMLLQGESAGGVQRRDSRPAHRRRKHREVSTVVTSYSCRF
jgi:hypothetical protein